MNRNTLTFAAIAILYGITASAQTVGNETVCFVPGPVDCASQIVQQINLAQKSLHVQAFNVNEPHIADAIIRAKARGVDVWLIVDKTAPHERGGVTQEIANAGVPTYVDYIPHIAHNKVMVIDGSTVLGGSFNYTTSADLHNAENMTVTHDPAFAALYQKNFAGRLTVSRPLAEYEAAK